MTEVCPRGRRKRRQEARRLKHPRPLWVLSDSTGNLARHMLTAFATQFPQNSFTIHVRPFLVDNDRIENALEEARQAAAIVFHAVVSEPAKRLIEGRCKQWELPCCDLTGQFVQFLSATAGVRAVPDAHELHRIDDRYRERIRAIDFTLEHDDGLGLDTLHDADVVLTGVSRTGKTPTAIYLAQQGYRVANVSLAVELDAPAQLLALPPHKVIAFVVDPGQLASIRSRRQTGWRMSLNSYAEQDHVTRELNWSKRLFARRGWRVLDVTDRAIEETAARIIELIPVLESTRGITPGER